MPSPPLPSPRSSHWDMESGLYRCLIQTGEDSGIVTHLEGARDTWLTL